MSMLAEGKRKQKWSLNPRGKAWAQDTNKFGQKLLEKMGWSQGKGLGANEDGRTDHIKVSYKNDAQGMGYKESDNQWTEHESNFTALLAALGGGKQENSEIKLSSLEEKSQNSKARVHYKKFTRGKDLSRYSEKDLANIFGKKTLKEVKKAKKDIKTTEKEVSDTEKDKNFSNAGLMSDYFKKKIPNFGRSNGYAIGNNGVLTKDVDSESESEQKPSFGFGFNQSSKADVNGFSEKVSEFESDGELRPSFQFENTNVLQSDKKIAKSSFVSYVYKNNVNDVISPKKKNKKKRGPDDDTANIDDTPSKKKKIELTGIPEGSSVKKKRNKPKKKIIEDSGLSNPAFQPLYSPTKVEKHILNPIEESIDESFNDTLNDTVGQVAENFEVQVQINNEITPVKRKEYNFKDNTSKKKKKKKDTIDMDISCQIEDNTLNESISQSVNETAETPKKKKRKSKNTEEFVQGMDTSILNVAMENSFVDNVSKKEKKKCKLKIEIEGIPSILSVTEEQYVSSKKKKSKTKKTEEDIDNPFLNVSLENDSYIVETTENPYEVKVKKKNNKNKENVGVENPVFNGDDSVLSNDLINEEYEVKRKDKSKKKKRKNKEENSGIDNPALNLNDTIEESCDLMLNVVSTPVLTNKEKSVLEEKVSIKKVKGVVRRKSVRFSDVTRERIIPSKEEIETETLDESRDILEIQGKLNDSSDMTSIDMFIQKKKAKKRNKGLVNGAFDHQANNIEENINSISSTLDTFQAEIENDINEAKLKSVDIDDIMVGEVGNPDGTNEKLPDGSVKLKFKFADFKKVARYTETLTGAKKSYKHLIKGDIIMQFKETNLHEIDGYAVAKAS